MWKATSRKRKFFIFVIGGLTLFALDREADRLAGRTWFQPVGEIHDRVHTSEKLVALTFDDGPNPPYTNQLLDVLDREHVKATFFFIGRNVEKNPEVARLVSERGHQVCNHSYSHVPLVNRWPSFVRSEIEKTDALLRQAGVKGEIYFRPPMGKKFLVLPYFLWKGKRKDILYSVNSHDYLGKTRDEIEKSVLEQAGPGDIILLHDGGGRRAETVAATQKVVRALKKKGFRFLTVQELLSHEAGR